MRTLGLNKQSLWLVKYLSTTDNLDSNGHKTGEKIRVFDEPVQIKLALSPYNGSASRESFGVSQEYDMSTVLENDELNELDLLFYAEPVSDFSTSYDFIVSAKLKSMHQTKYLLKHRG